MVEVLGAYISIYETQTIITLFIDRRENNGNGKTRRYLNMRKKRSEYLEGLWTICFAV